MFKKKSCGGIKIRIMNYYKLIIKPGLILADKFLRLFNLCIVLKVDVKNRKALDIMILKTNKDYYKG